MVLENTNYKINRDDIYVGEISSTNFNNIKFYQKFYDFELASEKTIYEEFDNQKTYVREKVTYLV